MLIELIDLKYICHKILPSIYGFSCFSICQIEQENECKILKILKYSQIVHKLAIVIPYLSFIINLSKMLTRYFFIKQSLADILSPFCQASPLFILLLLPERNVLQEDETQFQLRQLKINKTKVKRK